MAITDLKITNLDGATPADIPTTNLPAGKLKVEENGKKLVWSGLTTDPGFPTVSLYEVSWTDEKGDNKVRGSSSDCKFENNVFTASGLTVVTGLGLNINGKLKIKDPKATDDKVSAVISVRIGNMGEGTRGQWVIDLSDKQGGSEGSSLNVSALIAWTKAQAGITEEAEMPPMEADQKKKLEEFVINFEQFHFNITKKTFDIDVRSKAGTSLTIGAFVIDEVGFQLTNEPPKEKDPEDVEAEEVEETGANKLKASRKPKELPVGQH